MTPPAPRGRLLLLGACLAAFTTTLDNTVVAVALRDVQRDLGGGIAGLQGTVTAYTVALAALLLTGGTLVDVLGRRRTLLAGLALFTAASAGCALAGSGRITPRVHRCACPAAGETSSSPSPTSAASPTPSGTRRSIESAPSSTGRPPTSDTRTLPPTRDDASSTTTRAPGCSRRASTAAASPPTPAPTTATTGAEALTGRA